MSGNCCWACMYASPHHFVLQIRVCSMQVCFLNVEKDWSTKFACNRKSQVCNNLISIVMCDIQLCPDFKLFQTRLTVHNPHENLLKQPMVSSFNHQTSLRMILHAGYELRREVCHLAGKNLQAILQHVWSRGLCLDSPMSSPLYYIGFITNTVSSLCTHTPCLSYLWCTQSLDLSFNLDIRVFKGVPLVLKLWKSLMKSIERKP